MFCKLYCNNKNKIKLKKKNLWKPDFFADPQARRRGPQGVRGPQFENRWVRHHILSMGDSEAVPHLGLRNRSKLGFAHACACVEPLS